MAETRTKKLPDGTTLRVHFVGDENRKHQFQYPDEATPGDKGIKCTKCGKARSNAIHSGVSGTPQKTHKGRVASTGRGDFKSKNNYLKGK